MSPGYLVFPPPLLPCCSLDYLGWQLLNQPFLFHMYVCMYVCIFIKLHITAQSGPVIYPFHATACNPPGGYLSQTYSWLEMCVHTAMTPLPATTALGRNPTPSTSTTTLCPKKNMRRRRGKWWIGLSPSNTRVKLVSCRLAHQIETAIRQTGSTMANSPCNLPLQTQKFRPPPHQTVQRTAAVV